MKDKRNILLGLSSKSPISVEVGCGNRKRDPSSIGIDLIDKDDVDIVGDVLEVLAKMPDKSVKHISSYHVFEHILDLPPLLEEVERVLVPGGLMSVVAPHFTNPFYYSDPTHQKFFGLYTFSYYCEDLILRRSVPAYARQAGLELIDIKLIFKSFPPRYITYAFRKCCQLFFNLSNWTKEVYEDSFSNLITCYEVQYRIRKV